MVAKLVPVVAVSGHRGAATFLVEQPLADFMGLDELARVYRLADILRAQPKLLLA